jgi:meso-butanediol dehydrogenase / (S,S)-butanediol dehydrogenase / diacetyl reductase
MPAKTGDVRSKGVGMRLEGKVALITGGGTGIGAAVAKRFVEEGAKVCITGRRREKLEEVAQSLPAGACTIAQGDCCADGDPESMVAAALGITGKLDILVNNAAIEHNKNVVDLDVAVWRQTLENNLTGPFLMMKAAIPHMVKAGSGSIINVSSLAGVRAVPGGPGYCATKAGIIHLTKQVALDFGKNGIRCNVICPGPARTALLEMNVHPLTEVLHTDLDGVFEKMGEFVPLKRIASPADMTGLFVFLASEDSNFMTGTTLMNDGGIHVIDAFAAGVGTLGGEWG